MFHASQGSKPAWRLGFLAAAWIMSGNGLPAWAGSVALLRTPNGGVQPQAIVDSRGAIHLIYFKGDPAAGDVFYVRMEPARTDFSAPLRVNSQPGSAVALGTIRGAQLALGRAGRIHVAWNGSRAARPRGPGGTPLLYTRLEDSGMAFEPQRNLITWAGGLDGGGSVAADARGNVYVAWHAGPSGKGEAERAVFLAHSTDDGQTFAREKRANPAPTGACGCCGMRLFVDHRGALCMAYRAAAENVDRAMILITSTDAAASFRSTLLEKWETSVCPMSSTAFAEAGGRVFSAWETAGQVSFAPIDPALPHRGRPIGAPGPSGARKHPVLAGNARGEILFAWTEGTGWQRGGALAWQVYDRNGVATAERGRAAGVPVWGLLAALARPDGSFVVLY